MTGPRIGRRDWLGACLSSLAFGRVGAASGVEGLETITFRLRETAGLRRFSFPVHALLPGVPTGPSFRLECDGKPVPAQFRKVEGTDGRPAVALDFNASPGPLETQVYTVRCGDTESGPEPSRGMSISHDRGVFRVSHGTTLAFEVPENLDGLLRSVENTRLSFWSGGGRLTVETRDGLSVPLPSQFAMKSGVSREGPFAVGLRFEGSLERSDAGEVRSAVSMTFPNSKSWVEGRWTLDDPAGQVIGLAADFGLKIEGETTLVDLGATGTVYGFLRGREVMALEAGQAPGAPGGRAPWTIIKGTPPEPPLFASATTRPSVAEGWAHVMDRTRCTALAVEGFGHKTLDRLQIEAGGRVSLARRFAAKGEDPGRSPKSLRFWLHFVSNPVQVGAVTSPQAMLAPLQVDWDRPG
jgi:hypothetical protein